MERWGRLPPCPTGRVPQVMAAAPTPSPFLPPQLLQSRVHEGFPVSEPAPSWRRGCVFLGGSRARSENGVGSTLPCTHGPTAPRSVGGCPRRDGACWPRRCLGAVGREPETGQGTRGVVLHSCVCRIRLFQPQQCLVLIQNKRSCP